MDGVNGSSSESGAALDTPLPMDVEGNGHGSEGFAQNNFLAYRSEVKIQALEMLEAGAGKREASLRDRCYYYGRLRCLLSSVVEEGKRVLCLRSDVGQFLDWVRPSRGLGIEIVPGLTELARAKYPQFEFRTGDVENPQLDETFDYVLIVNAVNELFDVQATLENVRTVCAPHTRVVIVFHNFLWQPMAGLAETLGLKRTEPPQSWLSFTHLSHLLSLAGFDAVRRHRELLWPFYVPLVSWIANDCLARLPLIDKLCFVQAVIARPSQPSVPVAPLPSVSVIIPCKNEAGNVEWAVRRTPEMGSSTELIFCDDRSTDGTADEILRMQLEFPERNIRFLDGPGICKAENVWTGFDCARNDILMILDGDLTVPPEELPKFYEALAGHRGEFINGTRMVYPMRNDAMRMLNVFGNRIFSLLFTRILRQEISDTLCGTKALWRSDYERMRPLRGTWGIRDRWGDFELIFGAAKLGLKHIDLPVHYMERTYGKTKMNSRLRNAWVMLRMCFAATRKLH